MFSLKRKQSTKDNTVKKIKRGSQGFDDSCSSEEELDAETKFLNSIKQKTQKINTQISQYEDKNIQKLVDTIGENKPIIKDGIRNDEPKYMHKLIETNKKRKYEQKVMKYEAIDKKISGKDVFVYESNEYKKEKDHILGNSVGDDDTDDNVRDDVLFFNNIINSRLREHSSISINTAPQISNSVSQIPYNGKKSPNIYPSVSSNNTENVSKNHTNNNIQESSRPQFDAKIREYVKSKITATQLDEYKVRYWERVKSKITL